MTGQNWHKWPDLFCQEKFFEVLGKGIVRELRPSSNQNVVSDFEDKF